MGFGGCGTNGAACSGDGWAVAVVIGEVLTGPEAGTAGVKGEIRSGVAGAGDAEAGFGGCGTNGAACSGDGWAVAVVIGEVLTGPEAGTAGVMGEIRPGVAGAGDAETPPPCSARLFLIFRHKRFMIFGRCPILF